MKRKIVQIAVAAYVPYGVALFALLDDGTCWRRVNAEWEVVPPLPDADEAEGK